VEGFHAFDDRAEEAATDNTINQQDGDIGPYLYRHVIGRHNYLAVRDSQFFDANVERDARDSFFFIKRRREPAARANKPDRHD
jgi:hypothetical protein